MRKMGTTQSKLISMAVELHNLPDRMVANHFGECMARATRYGQEIRLPKMASLVI
jgi:hypothetical protein